MQKLAKQFGLGNRGGKAALAGCLDKRFGLVKIRLRRGAKKHPSTASWWRLALAARRPVHRTSRVLRSMTDPVKVSIDVAKSRALAPAGRQPSEAARSLLKREGILERRA